MALHERLRRTRERLGLTLQQVVDRIGLSVPTISAYETGQREPSFAHLAKLAKLYHRPIESFFSEQVEPEEVVLWRVRPHAPAAEEIEAEFLELGGRYRALEVWADHVQPVRLPRFEAGWNDPSLMAASVRGALGLGDRPGAGLEETLQDAGVKVFHLAIEPRPASACTVTAAFGTAVLLNLSADRRERVFSLAHALFRLLTWGALGKDALQDETLADRFADCLLLPDDAVRQSVASHQRNGKLTFRELDLIASSFSVPLESLLRRIGYVLGWPKDEGRQLLARARTAGFTGAPDWSQSPPSRPRRFVELATRAYDEGKLSLGRLAEYLGISRQEAMKTFFHDEKDRIVDEEVLLAPA